MKNPTYKGFLADAFPMKLQDDELCIGFRENEFSKEQMESDYYNLPFQEIVQKVMNTQLKLSYFFKKDRKIDEKRNENMTKDILAYFSEE